MVALSVCRLTLGYRTAERVVNVKCDPVEEFTAWVANEDNGQRALWPGELRLSDRFLETLLEHAVPCLRMRLRGSRIRRFPCEVPSWGRARTCCTAPVGYTSTCA